MADVVQQVIDTKKVIDIAESSRWSWKVDDKSKGNPAAIAQAKTTGVETLTLHGNEARLGDAVKDYLVSGGASTSIEYKRTDAGAVTSVVLEVEHRKNALDNHARGKVSTAGTGVGRY